MTTFDKCVKRLSLFAGAGWGDGDADGYNHTAPQQASHACAICVSCPCQLA